MDKNNTLASLSGLAQMKKNVSVTARSNLCPVARFGEILAGKWATPVIYRLILADGPVRFNTLQRTLRPISQKELSRHLRHFEALGMVTRQVYAEVPPRVEYLVTDFGQTLRAPIEALAHWAEQYFPVSGQVHAATPGQQHALVAAAQGDRA